MRRSFSQRAYADRKAPDGVICSGWRRVKKGGKVKFGGSYYKASQLESIVGQLVWVHMGDYWMSHVEIHRGVIGCSEWYCKANAED